MEDLRLRRPATVRVAGPIGAETTPGCTLVPNHRWAAHDVLVLFGGGVGVSGRALNRVSCLPSFQRIQRCSAPALLLVGAAWLLCLAALLGILAISPSTIKRAPPFLSHHHDLISFCICTPLFSDHRPAVHAARDGRPPRCRRHRRRGPAPQGVCVGGWVGVG